MGNKNSPPSSHTSSKANTGQASATRKDPCHVNVDDNNADCQNTITQLQRVVNEINTSTDGDQCIHEL